MGNLKKYLVVGFFSTAFFLAGANSAFAALFPLSGYGWMGDDNSAQGFCGGASLPACVKNGLGHISFAGDTTAIDPSSGKPYPYGVFVNGDTGDLSGYAWSSNGGWITFNDTDMVTCNTNKILPSDAIIVDGKVVEYGTGGTDDKCPPDDPNPKAHMNIKIDDNGNITSGDGNFAKVSGWGRFCSIFVSGCSGPILPKKQTGGWDGWIALADNSQGQNYALEYDIKKQRFRGPPEGYKGQDKSCPTCWAWSGSTDGTGWGSGVNMLGTTIKTTPEVDPFSLLLWAVPTSIRSGESAKVKWIVKNINSCKRTGDVGLWLGAGDLKPADLSEGIHEWLTGSLTTDSTYTLQCKSTTGEDVERSATVSIGVPQDGKCGISANKPSRSKPSQNLCDIGTPSVVTLDGLWKWDCNGVNGGGLVGCTAPVKSGFKWVEF